MKKIFFLSIAALVLFSANTVSAQSLDEIELEDAALENQEQQQGVELSENELEGLLNTACSNSSTRNKRVVARKIVSEVDSSLSRDRLSELTETVLEIKELPSEEQLALCQS